MPTGAVFPCFSVVTEYVLPFVETAIVPFISVLYIFALYSSRIDNVEEAGWPYVFPAPTDITAISGVVAFKKASVVEELLP